MPQRHHHRFHIVFNGLVGVPPWNNHPMTDHRVRLEVFTRRRGQGQWRGVGGLGTLVLVNVFVRVLGKPRVGAEGVGKPFAVGWTQVALAMGSVTRVVGAGCARRARRAGRARR